MQNRVAPSVLAWRASATIASVSTSFSIVSVVSKWVDWGQ